MQSSAGVRNGFTLVEMLIALVITGVLAGALFQLFGGQGRFVEMQSSREEVQQNSRAAIELIGSELRTVPAGESLVAAADDSITFRASRMWGVVCAVPSATALDVSVPSVTGASFAVNAGTGVVVNLGSEAAPVWSNAVTASAISVAATDCDGEPVASGAERRRISLSSMPINGTDIPQPGDIIYLYDQISYRTGTSSGVPGTWIQRRIGNGNYQPMAGPIDAASGLEFSYYGPGSSTALSTPIADPVARADVERIRVVVEAVGRHMQGSSREVQQDTVVVSLRNRV